MSPQFPRKPEHGGRARSLGAKAEELGNKTVSSRSARVGENKEVEAVRQMEEERQAELVEGMDGFRCTDEYDEDENVDEEEKVKEVVTPDVLQPLDDIDVAVTIFESRRPDSKSHKAPHLPFAPVDEESKVPKNLQDIEEQGSIFQIKSLDSTSNDEGPAHGLGDGSANQCPDITSGIKTSSFKSGPSLQGPKSNFSTRPARIIPAVPTLTDIATAILRSSARTRSMSSNQQKDIEVAPESTRSYTFGASQILTSSVLSIQRTFEIPMPATTLPADALEWEPFSVQAFSKVSPNAALQNRPQTQELDLDIEDVAGGEREIAEEISADVTKAIATVTVEDLGEELTEEVTRTELEDTMTIPEPLTKSKPRRRCWQKSAPAKAATTANIIVSAT
ncbi:hypothetical protein VTL71DRAFT_11060 [Oculimacula yallundae]|uniref:Uncharacterized protein n=1 Tax=Oculimacula yallundae TaxID=86028 RepID=A0ABR4CUY2_9HELO